MNAARLGSVFHVDPVLLLDSDDVNWIIRLACGKVVERDNAEQAKASGV